MGSILLFSTLRSLFLAFWLYTAFKVKNKFEAEWPTVAPGPLGGGRWRHWQAYHSTRLSGSSAVSRRTCQTHVIYWVSLRPAGSVSLGSCSTSPSLNLHYKKDLMPSPVWWETETNIAYDVNPEHSVRIELNTDYPISSAPLRMYLLNPSTTNRMWHKVSL